MLIGENLRLKKMQVIGNNRIGSLGRFELPTLRLTADGAENLSAVSGVAYKKNGAIFPALVAPNLEACDLLVSRELE